MGQLCEDLERLKADDKMKLAQELIEQLKSESDKVFELLKNEMKLKN